MKISKETIEVMQSFSRINNSLLLLEGNTFHTRDINRTIFATATVPDSFPSEIGIYDLTSLLRYLKLVGDEPEIKMDGDDMLIQGKDTLVRYHSADKEMIICQETEPEIKEVPFATLNFNSDIVQLVRMVANVGVTKADTVEIAGKNGTSAMRIYNTENSSSNVVTRFIKGDIINESIEYKVSFKTDQFAMIDSDYILSIYSREHNGGLAFFGKFVSTNVSYLLPAKSNDGAFVKT